MQQLLDGIQAILDRATTDVSKLVTGYVVEGIATRLTGKLPTPTPTPAPSKQQLRWTATRKKNVAARKAAAVALDKEQARAANVALIAKYGGKPKMTAANAMAAALPQPPQERKKPGPKPREHAAPNAAPRPTAKPDSKTPRLSHTPGLSKEKVREAISDRRARVLAFLHTQSEPVPNGMVAEALGLHRAVVAIDMAYLGSEHKVTATGIGAGTRYAARP